MGSIGIGTRTTAPARGAAPRRGLWTAYAVLGALVAAYFVFLVVRRNSPYSPWVDGWSVDALEVVAAGMCIARGCSRRRGRGVAITLGLALLAWSAGDVALTIESLGGGDPPVPSAADAFYVAFYPLAYAGVVLFMRGHVRRLSTPTWLDGAVAGLGTAAVLAAFAFDGILRVAGGDTVSVATSLAYPVGDLLLLGLVVAATAVLPGGHRRPWILIATGLGLTVIGDGSALFGSWAGTAGGIADGIGWPIAIVLISMAVWLRPRPTPLAEQKPTGFVLPGLATASGIVVLVAGTRSHLTVIAIALAAATLVVAGARLTLSVTELRRLTQERLRLSVTDELTGLGNRRYLSQVLDDYFTHQADEEGRVRQLAFLFIDLNRFKEINDTFGHPAGDELLRQLGPRLAEVLRGTDVLVRLGGDEFAVVLIDADGEAATLAAGRISAALEQPFALEVVSAQIGASIGIALAPGDASDSTALTWAADIAMYRAKSSGVPFALYEQHLDDHGHRWHLAEELRDAIDDDGLVLHYQPQLDLHSREIDTIEALVRWQHPRLGLVPPANFLPLAEEAGLMDALTTWVLDHALAQCASWQASGRCLTVAVNVSAGNLMDDGFTDRVIGFLHRHGLTPDALIIEITETSVITDFERARMVIQELREAGVNVSIDDFGAGFTSLAHLSSLAVKELKLDRTFVTDLGNGRGRERDLQLVRATIELAHTMGLRVVAEGVEDNATLDLLTQIGCDVAQGYYIGKPKPADELALRPTADAALSRAAVGA